MLDIVFLQYFFKHKKNIKKVRQKGIKMIGFEISVAVFILLSLPAVFAGNCNKCEVVIDDDSAFEVEDSDILVPCMKVYWNYELMEVEYSVFETHGENHGPDSNKLRQMTSNLTFNSNTLTSN